MQKKWDRLGENIKLARKRRKLTAIQLAERAATPILFLLLRQSNFEGHSVVSFKAIYQKNSRMVWIGTNGSAYSIWQ